MSKCQCVDNLCPIHGLALCHNEGVITLYRVDMIDNTGTLFCEECGEDAMMCGLFDVDDDDDEGGNNDESL